MNTITLNCERLINVEKNGHYKTEAAKLRNISKYSECKGKCRT